MIWRIFLLWFIYLAILWTLQSSWLLLNLTSQQKYIWFWFFFIVSTIILSKMWYFQYKLKNKNQIYNQMIEEISRSKAYLVDYNINQNLIWMNLKFNIWWRDIFCYYWWEVKKLWTRDINFSYEKVPFLLKEWWRQVIIILRPIKDWVVFNINHWTNYNDEVIWRMYQKKIIDYLIIEAYNYILDQRDQLMLTNQELEIINNFVSRLDIHWNYNDWWKYINQRQKTMNLVDNMKEDSWD